MAEFTDNELEAYLDELLDTETMVLVEQQVRDDTVLAERLRAVLGRREAGVHSLGEIWRQAQVTCPDREAWGSYLLGVVEPAETAYMAFHLERIGCRFCRANVDDLQAQMERESPDVAASRRQRYFQTSARLVRKKK